VAQRRPLLPGLVNLERSEAVAAPEARGAGPKSKGREGEARGHQSTPCTSQGRLGGSADVFRSSLQVFHVSRRPARLCCQRVSFLLGPTQTCPIRDALGSALRRPTTRRPLAGAPTVANVVRRGHWHSHTRPLAFSLLPAKGSLPDSQSRRRRDLPGSASDPTHSRPLLLPPAAAAAAGHCGRSAWHRPQGPSFVDLPRPAPSPHASASSYILTASPTANHWETDRSTSRARAYP